MCIRDSAAAVAAYAVANLVAVEAGLFATTVVGICLANQRSTPIADIAAFEEGVGVLAIGSLFVVLGARVPVQGVLDNLGPALVVLAVLVLVARPLAVLASTVRSNVDRPSALFMMALAPRGIVAAATASVFALDLEEAGIEGAETLISVTFVAVSYTHLTLPTTPYV